MVACLPLGTFVSGLREIATVVLISALIISLAYVPVHNRLISQDNTYSAWAPVDAGIDDVYAAGEHIGKLYTDLVEPPWYSDAAIVAETGYGIIASAWVRKDVDLAGNDYIYVAFLKPEDTDGDGYWDAYSKVVKFVARARTVRGIDSMSSDNNYLLITWTYVNTYGKDAVAGAVIFLSDYSIVWSGDIASSDTTYNEFSRSCHFSSYFLVVWYSSDGYIYGTFVGPGGPGARVVQIASTDGLYWRRADQMLCIGGYSNALLVYRKYDSTEDQPDLYAALIDSSLSATEIKLYDYGGAEETVGVRGAYVPSSGPGYFVVPFVSGSYVGYSVISEADGSIIRQTTHPGRGMHPYAIGLTDRAVMTWIGSDGSIKVGNIDTTNWYIHIMSWTDTDYAYHPILLYDDYRDEYAVAYTGGGTTTDTDVRIAVLSSGQPTDTPTLLSGYPETLVGGPGNQSLVGMAGTYLDHLAAFYIDHGVGERNLMAYVTAMGASELASATLYKLPADADAYKQAVIDMINAADEENTHCDGILGRGPGPVRD